MTESVIVDRICQLMKREGETLGFIPKPRIAEHVRRGLFQLQMSQREIVGYMIHGPYREALSVHQVCVDLAARRLAFAQMMEAALTLNAWDAGSQVISLACRADLEANLFWRACGYAAFGREAAGIKRRVTKIRWQKTMSIDHKNQALERLANLVQ